MIFGKSLSKLRNSSLIRAPAGQILTLNSPEGWEIGRLSDATQTSAMKLSAVSACVDVITNSMSKLPMYVMDKKTKEEQKDHSLKTVLCLRPNEAMTPSVYKKLMETYRLLWGNAYAVPVRSGGTGRIEELIPLPADYTTPYIDENGQLWYVSALPGREPRKFRSWDVIHLKNFSYDGITGISTLTRAAEVITTALTAQRYENKFYTQGASPPGVIEVQSKIESGAKEAIRKDWHRIHSGADNAFKVAVLDLGMKYQHIGVTQKDAQFVESKNVSVEDITRFFGVPLYKVNAGKQSYSSNEQNSIEYVVETLHPIVEQGEEEYTYKLLFDSEIRSGLEIKIEMMAELRGDVNSRGQWYTNMRNAGVFSVDDILALEDMPGVPGGDVRMASLNYVPLDEFRELSKQRNVKDLTDAAGMTAAGTDIAKVSLNVAQIQSLLNIIQAVVKNEIGYEAAVTLIIAAFPFSEETTRKILGEPSQLTIGQGGENG